MAVSLLDLAREESSDRRRELLQEVSNIFVDGAENHTDRELVLFGEVLGRLLDHVSVDDRAAFSSRVAALAQTSRDLALKLANDAIQVAAPVLQHSPSLTDDDLVDLASRQGQTHLAAISRRDALSEHVTDVLVDRGEAIVLNTVARNLGARFSEQGFGALAAKAADDDSLGEALSFRDDLPVHIAEKVAPVLNQVARKRLELLIQQDSGRAQALMDDAKRAFDVGRADSKRGRFESKIMVADVRSGKRRLDEALDDLIHRGRLIDIAHVLADLAQVPEAHVSNVLHKLAGTGIAVVCRTLDVSETVYDRLSRLRCERLRVPPAQAEPMLREYQQLDRATAERTLRFHRVRSTVRG
ncbi:DUF2336 domain-containing protein [Methyloraptor flagellatus]|jgi:uncharacterized protein (DUF2336 family)|uniref:DUF2336 domain-containing protein n=1 Tax=Methyloraptor flagellatus TaxID=3162530 RepID=A0AAU7XBG1_9HYPH